MYKAVLLIWLLIGSLNTVLNAKSYRTNQGEDSAKNPVQYFVMLGKVSALGSRRVLSYVDVSATVKVNRKTKLEFKGITDDSGYYTIFIPDTFASKKLTLHFQKFKYLNLSRTFRATKNSACNAKMLYTPFYNYPPSRRLCRRNQIRFPDIMNY